MDDKLAKRHNQGLLETLLNSDNLLPPMERRVAAQRLLSASRHDGLKLDEIERQKIEVLANE